MLVDKRVMISACYIVKNEETNLLRSLQSVCNEADEIVIVDTGSTDDTVAIAEKYNARIFSIPWENDFSKARNFALKQARGEWILFLDADEYLVQDRPNTLRQIVEKAIQKKQTGGILVSLYNVDTDDNDKILDDALVLRFFYNGVDYHYEGRIHEQLMDGSKNIEPLGVVSKDDLYLIHTGYKKSLSKKKAQRNLDLLLQELRTTKRPERLYVYLADSYLGLNNYEMAWHYAMLGIKKGEVNITNASRPYRILLELAYKMNIKLNDRITVCELATKAFPNQPEFRAELAECLGAAGDYFRAIAEMEKALDLYECYSDGETMQMSDDMVAVAKQRIEKWKNLVVQEDNGSGEVSIIIPVYGNLSSLQTCMSLLRTYAGKHVGEVIVVDNDSDIETKKWLYAYPGIRLIKNNDNLGTAAAYNQGATIAKGKYYLFMHSDICITPNTISHMVEILRGASHIGAVGPYCNRVKGNAQIVHIDNKYTTLEEMLRFAAQRKNQNKANRYTMVLEDCCMLVAAEAYKKVGGFNEAFSYSTWADYDFSLNMHKAGFSLYIVDEFIHHNIDSYRTNNMDIGKINDIYDINLSIFKEKWNVSPFYSIIVRDDILQYIDTRKDNIRVLDVGCACGGNLMTIRMQNKTANLYGVEINKKAAEVAANYADVRSMDISKIEPNDFSVKFDYIICGDVLEHLYDPWGVLKKLQMLLSENGKVIISLPNINFIEIIRDLLIGEWTYKGQGILDRTHLRFFTRKTALELVEQAGLKPINVVAVDVGIEPNSKLGKFYEEIKKLQLPAVETSEFIAFQWLIVAQNKRGMKYE